MDGPEAFTFGVVLLAFGIMIGRWTKRRPIVITGVERDAKGRFGKMQKPHADTWKKWGVD